MNKKISFNLTDTSKTSTWNLFMATLVDTLKKDEGHRRLRGKKNASIKDENSLFLNISKEYYEWLHLFRKDIITLPQHQL